MRAEKGDAILVLMKPSRGEGVEMKYQPLCCPREARLPQTAGHIG